MTENEKILHLLQDFLICAKEVQQELNDELENIENPKTPTRTSKRKIRERMRLINNIIYVGMRIEECLQADEKKLTKRNKRR